MFGLVGVVERTLEVILVGTVLKRDGVLDPGDGCRGNRGLKFFVAPKRRFFRPR